MSASDAELTPPEPKGRAPVDAQGNERPAFLLDFPEDPALDAVIAAFEAGNYARVRELAPRVATEALDPEVRAAALELRRRIEPDPISRYVVVISAVLLLFLAVWSYAVQAR